MAIEREIIESEIRTTGGKQVQDEIIKVNQAIKSLATEEKNLLFIKNKLESQGKKNTEEYKRNTEALKLNREAAAKQKEELTKLNSQLKITDMTYNQLSKRATELRSKLNNMSQSADPAKWQKYNRELTQVQQQMTRVKSGTQQTSSALGSMSKVAGILGISIGGVWGALKIGKTILESTDASADELEEAIQGATSAWEYFKKSLASGDFSNFFRNMKLAAEAGREYAKALDDIENRNRALTLSEAENNVQKQEDLKTLRNQMATDDEQTAAAYRIIEAEDKLMETRKSIARQAIDARLESFKTLGITEEIVLENLHNYELNREIIKQADEYNELLQDRNELAGASTGGMSSDIKVQGLAELDALIAKAPEAVKKFAELRNTYTDLKEAELDELVKLYVDWYNATASADENLQRVNSRLSSIQEENAKKIAKETESQVDAKQKETESEVAAEQKRDEEIEKLRTALYSRLDDITKTFITSQLSRQDQELMAIADKYNAEVSAFLQAKDNQVITEQEAADAVQQIWEMQAQEMMNKSLEHQQEENELIAEETMKKNEEDLETTKKQLEAKAELEDEYEARKLALRQQQAAQIGSIFQAGADLVDELQKNELQKLEDQYDRKIQLAGKNNTLVTKLEEERERKAKAIKKKYADVDFHLKVLQINASTAQGIMGVWGNNTLPYPAAAIFNAIMSAIIGATGIAQVAAANRARNQAKSLYTGGYSGDGGKYEVAGVVHKREYVVAEEELGTPQVRSFIGSIVEPMRMRRLSYSPYAYNTTMPGYAQGGYSGDGSAGINSMMLANVHSSISRQNILLEVLLTEGVNANFNETKIYEMRQRIEKQQTGEYIARRGN